ncbi:MAG: MYXO-CTERM sorting domain-containing protein, partial [Polyangiaceae bacterium]
LTDGSEDGATDGSTLSDGETDGSTDGSETGAGDATTTDSSVDGSGGSTDGARSDAGDAADGSSPLDTGVIEGGGCSCTMPARGGNGDAAWLLVGVAFAARAVRRKRK